MGGRDEGLCCEESFGVVGLLGGVEGWSFDVAEKQRISLQVICRPCKKIKGSSNKER